MRIAVGSDHAGFDLKSALAEHLAAGGHEVVDLGTDSPDVSVDYPVFGLAVARAVAQPTTSAPMTPARLQPVIVASGVPS